MKHLPINYANSSAEMNMNIVCMILLGIFCNLNICDMKECGKADDKRLLLHSESDVMNELLKLKSELANLTSDNNALKMKVTELQSKVNHLEKSDGLGNLTRDMTASTYIRWGKNSCSSDSEVIYQDFLPCTVCKSKRTTSLMIPARKDCYPGWTMEYWGYLMTSSYDMASASNHICLDAKPDFNPHGAQNDDQHMIYPVEGRCGSLPCPPYVNGRELTCVVCSK